MLVDVLPNKDKTDNTDDENRGSNIDEKPPTGQGKHERYELHQIRAWGQASQRCANIG